MLNFSDENLDITNHEQNHETATMLHYLNSSLLRFNLDKISSNKHHKYIKSKIKDEIPTSDEIEQMLETFFEKGVCPTLLKMRLCPTKHQYLAVAYVVFVCLTEVIGNIKRLPYLISSLWLNYLLISNLIIKKYTKIYQFTY